MDRQRDRGPDPTDSLEWLTHEDPYEEVDVDRLPDWWAEASEEFRDHHLPPYNPPRFADDAFVPTVIERLENAHDVEIRLMGVDVEYGDSWGVYVDGTLVESVERERTAEAYTRYGITSDEFETIVRGSASEEV
jgi:hypothetical protein